VSSFDEAVAGLADSVVGAAVVTGVAGVAVVVDGFGADTDAVVSGLVAEVVLGALEVLN
jgi:hypothetical protein